MTKLLLTAATLIALLGSPAHAKPRDMYQSCTGTLIIDQDGEYQLKPNAGSGLWCDAIISTGVVPRVLKICAVNGRCSIKGTFEGHGIFYWNRVDAVKRPAL